MSNFTASIIESHDRRLDANITKLIDSYRTILSEAQILDGVQNQKSLILFSSAANIVHAGQSLLDQIHELRMHIILQDYDEIHAEVENEREVLQTKLATLNQRAHLDEQQSDTKLS